RMKLTEKDWAILSDLLDDALDMPLSARAAWVEGLDDRFGYLQPVLRRLLVAAGSCETETFLRTLVKLDSSTGNVSSGLGFGAGLEIGPYRLLRELGVGGMGAVWLAERSDGALKREVALKLPFASIHQAAVAERFVRERDILASLTHPHIARLYD